MGKIYVLVGIEGMPLIDDKNIFTIDRIVARDILSGDNDRFTIDEIMNNYIEILGLPIRILKDWFEYNYLSYNACKMDIIGNRECFRVGLIPVYYSDNLSRMPDYIYDSENYEVKYLGDIDSNSVDCESILVSLYVEKNDDDFASRCSFVALLSLNSGLEICADVYDYENDIANTFDSNGNIVENTKYFLSSAFGIYDANLEKLKNSGLALIKEGDSEEVTEFITDDLHIVNASYLPKGTTLITGSKCRVLVMCSDSMIGSRNNWNIVISPSVVKILNELFGDHESLETKNIKLFISHKMKVDILINFVKTFTFRFDDRIAIGFSEFNEDDKYESKLNKCLGITGILESNDTSNRLFNDIEYLVEKLNQIGFNIELY